MTVGSAICTGAPTSQFGVLLFGRALQGVGAAGVNVVGHVIMADRVSLEDFAWNWTLSALISAVFFGIGPVVGGHLTQVNWRWCFAINLPIAVVGMLLIVIILGKDLVGPQPIPGVSELATSTRSRRLLVRFSTIDFGGQLLFLSGLTLTILAFTWAGGTYPWDSVQVLAPLVIGAVLTAMWFVYEYLMSPPHLMSRIFPIQTAMIPWELLQQKNVTLVFFINFASGMAMFSVMYFMDLYFALVLKATPGEAGKYLLYYLPGLAGKSRPNCAAFPGIIGDTPEADKTTYSGRVHGTVCDQYLAQGDFSTALPGLYHLGRRNHRAGVGYPRGDHEHHPGHDGADRPRRRDADEPERLARARVLPGHDGADHLPRLVGHSPRGHRRVDADVNRFQ